MEHLSLGKLILLIIVILVIMNNVVYYIVRKKSPLDEDTDDTWSNITGYLGFVLIAGLIAGIIVFIQNNW
jgi:hypothetical protein